MNTGEPLVAVLMCHAPLVIPAIGGDRGTECAATTLAMREAAQALAASGAETAVILSPHLPRHSQAFGVVASEKLHGDFDTFGHPELTCSFRGDAAVGAAVARTVQRAGLEMQTTDIRGLDHGAMVPLWFLQEAGFKGRIVVFGFPWHRDGTANRTFGAALKEAMQGLDRKWVLLASGDMSHALLPGAPSGFHPLAQSFDDAVVHSLSTGNLATLSTIPRELRDVAAEDVMDSLESAIGVLGHEIPEVRLLSYEGPFGVGYLIAILKDLVP